MQKGWSAVKHSGLDEGRHALLITARSASFLNMSYRRLSTDWPRMSGQRDNDGPPTWPSSTENDRNFVSSCLDQLSAQEFAWQFRRSNLQVEEIFCRLTERTSWSLSSQPSFLINASYSYQTCNGGSSRVIGTWYLQCCNWQHNCTPDFVVEINARQSEKWSAVQVASCSSASSEKVKGSSNSPFSVLHEEMNSGSETFQHDSAFHLHCARIFSSVWTFRCIKGVVVVLDFSSIRLQITSRSEFVHGHADVHTS